MSPSSFIVALVAIVCVSPALGQSFRQGGTRSVRYPILPHVARVQNSDVECTAIYTVELTNRYTNQGNDISHLPTHGKDTSIYRDNENFNDAGSSRNRIGANYVNHPFPTDAEKQAFARSQFSVTALTEREDQAFPLGFKKDTLHMYHAVCVTITGLAGTTGRDGRWVEIMAQSTQSDQQICVESWKPEDPQNPGEGSCGNGELYVCRDSDTPWNDFKSDKPAQNPSRSDTMNIKFLCKDSCDDPEFGFFWRISASQEKPVCLDDNPPADPTQCNNFQQPDGENWCAMRAGDDFPSSLLNPYPAEYDPPPVFGSVGSSAASTTASVFLLAAVALLCACFL